MFVAFTALLSIFHLVYADTSTESTKICENVNDDDALKEVLNRMDLIQITNENFGHQIELQNTNMDRQFRKQQNEFEKRMDEQQNEFKKYFEQQINEFKKYIDQQFSKQENKINQAIISSRGLTSADEALENSGRSDLYKIEISNAELEVCLCSEMEKNTEAWIIVLRRQDGSVDFDRNWSEYQKGFGNSEGEFFIGLDKLHELTQSTFHELWIHLEDFDGNKRCAKYSSFAIGGENETYILNELGAYTGDAGDSLRRQAGQKWTTMDADNDKNSDGNCAKLFSGAWWFSNCHDSNLNGKYYRGGSAPFGKGVEWDTWRGAYYSLKFAQMAIRPVPCKSQNII